MQRIFLALISVLLLTIGIMPSAAQGGSIAAIIDSRSDLSTLKVFLDAADPSVRDMLASSGSYTLFAPNNVAFQNLSSLLAIPLQDLLQNPEIVTQILQYHVIDGAYDGNRVAQLNGQVVPTQLLGAFLGIRLDDNNVVTINNVVEIEQTNIRASNGYVHIVNDVLLNRLIAAAVQNANLASAITPNPGVETETPTPVASVEPTETANTIPVGNLRVAHFVADSDAIDVYINDTILFDDIAFADVSRFVSLQPGTYSVAFAPVNTSVEKAILSPVTVTVADGAFITVSAIGSAANESIEVSLLEEDYTPLADEMSRLTVYHALEGVEAIDVVEAGAALLENIAYGETATVDLATGIYEPAITLNGDEDNLLEPMRVSLWNGSYYFAALIGSVDAPQLVITSVRADEANEFRTGRALAGGDGQVPLGGSDASELNVIDTLKANDEFSLLVAVLEVADEEVINRLGSVNAVTLLAPTDRAFENLITTLNMTEDEFLSETEIITDILLYHVINSEILATDFRDAAGTSVITMLPQNQAFFVTVTDNGTILLNGFVQFEQVDIRTSNGVIHIIEDVLLPQSVVQELGL
jgi:uncharacterized surface protein with fasciclin (FAS1) repeats